MFFLSSLYSYGEQRVGYTENKGQWESKIKFRAVVPSGNLILFQDRIVYQQIKGNISGNGHPGHLHSASELFADSSGASGHVVSVQFLNSNLTNPTGSQAQTAQSHYFYGSKGNFTNVQSFQQVCYPQLYPGIDLKFYEVSGVPKYEYIIKPKVDHHLIKMKYDGANKLSIVEGKLIVQTSVGEITEQAPIAYQIDKGRRLPVACKYRLEGNILSFDFPKGYNPELEIVIDPALIFSTYSGSYADNWGNTATYDADGNMYSGGIVFGNSGLPTTPGPFSGFKGGAHDVYILKFDPSGSNLLFAAYLGGTGNEFPRSMIVNHKNELVILGTTDSPDFPVTSGVFDPNYHGGPGFLTFFNLAGTVYDGYPAYLFPRVFTLLGPDMFIAKINSSGDSLLAATYIGGSGADGYLNSKSPLTKNYGDQLRGEVIVDANDDIYFASNTYSGDIPYINGFQGTNNGQSDGLVGKVSSDLTTVHWMSYLGGSGEDATFGIKLDAQGNVFVTGGASSNNIFSPATGIISSQQGNVDAIVAKISQDGQTLLASTYLGTSSYDQAYFLDMDDQQNVYILGQTSGNYPMDTSVYHVAHGGQFLHALTNNLDTTIFSTVFGSGSGKPDISLTAFLVNSCAKIYISGWGGELNATVNPNFFYNGSSYYTGYGGGSTQNLPITNDAYQSNTDGSDFYFLVLNKKAKSLEYATYFGGMGSEEHVDGGTSRFDKSGYIYQSVCAGCGGNSGFPTSATAWSRVNRSQNCNNAALKFDLSTLRAKFETFKTAWTDTGYSSGCAPLKVLFNNISTGGNYYKWIWGNGTDTNIVQKDSISHIFKVNKRVKVQLVAFDNSTCAETDTASAIIQVGDIAKLSSDTTICYGQGFHPTLIVLGDTSIQWTPNYLISDTTVKRPYLYPLQTTTYHVVVKDSLGCTSTDSIKVSVRGYIKANFQTFKSDTTFPGFHEGCVSLPVLFKDSSIVGNKFYWNFGNGQTLTTPGSFYLDTYTTSGVYPVTLIVYDTVCHYSDTLTKHILASQPTATFPSNFIMCALDSIQLKVQTSPINSISWSPVIGLGKPYAAVTNFYDTLNHVYTIQVKDTLNCTITDTLSITAKNIIPKANFQTYKSDTTEPGFHEGCVSLAVLFKDKSSVADKFYWNFGNGQSITTPGVYFLNSYTISGLYPVVLIVTDTICHLSDTLTKSILASIPTATFPSNFIMCALDSVQLKVQTSPLNSISWSPISGIGKPYAAVTNFYDTLSHVFTIHVEDTLNCSINDTLKITAKNRFPKANFQTYKPDSTIPGYNQGCVPLSILFKNESSGEDLSYWDFGNGQTTTSSLNKILSTYSARNIYTAILLVTNTTCGLKDSLTKPITALQPTATFPPDFTNCSLGSITLTVNTSPMNTVSWQPSTDLGSPNAASTQYLGYTNQTYTILVKDVSNCTVSGTLNITAKNQVPIAKFSLYNLPDSTLSNGIACAPFSFLAKDKSQFSDQNIWDWQGSTSVNQKIVMPSYSTEGVSSIRLIAVNTYCNLRDTVSAPVRINVPHVLFPNDSQVCIGEHVQLEVKSNSLKSIEWNPNININNTTVPNPIVWASMPLRYEVTFLDTNGCTASDTVHVSNFPVAQPHLVKQIAFCKKQTATVSLDPGTFKTYRWNDNSTDQVLMVDTAGFYKVSLSDFNNCQYTDSATVVQICAPIVFVPSGFSPNGDGKNDQFEVFGTYVTTFTIDIFNRWGELIYHSDDFGFKWDGTYRGVDVPIGVYPYTIHYGGTTTEGIAVKESLKGNVTVIR